MNCVYFVMSGAVEIMRTATQEDAEREFSGNTSIEHSFTVDIDESLMLDCSMVGDMMPIGAVNGRLHIDRLKVCTHTVGIVRACVPPADSLCVGVRCAFAIHHNMRLPVAAILMCCACVAAALLLLLLLSLQARDLKTRHRGHLMEHQEVVVDVKGPGQVVGEVFMQEAPPPCRYSARARGDVLALKLTQENYVRALAAMMYEAEHGARATANSVGATRGGRPLPSATASSPGLLGVPLAAGAGSSSGLAAQAAPIPGAGRPPAQPGSFSSGFQPGSFSPTHSFTSHPASLSANPSFNSSLTAPGGGAFAAGRGAAAAGLMQSSTCGSISSVKEPSGQPSSSTPGDSSTAPLSVLAATNTSSSGSLAHVRGGHASPHRGSGPLASIQDGGSTGGSTAEDSGPLKLIGFGDATDDESPDLPSQQQQQQQRLRPHSKHAAPAAAAVRPRAKLPAAAASAQ